MIPETIPVALAAFYGLWRYFNIMEARFPKPTKTIQQLETDIATLKREHDELKSKLNNLTLAAASGRAVLQRRI